MGPRTGRVPAVRLAQAVTIPIIASGGVHHVGDVEALCRVEDEGIEAVICGRSIYEGTLDLRSGQDRADELTRELEANRLSGSK